MTEEEKRMWLKIREAHRRPDLEQLPGTPKKQSLLSRLRQRLDLDSDFMEAFFGCLAAMLLYSPFGFLLATLAARIVSVH